MGAVCVRPAAVAPARGAAAAGAAVAAKSKYAVGRWFLPSERLPRDLLDEPRRVRVRERWAEAGASADARERHFRALLTEYSCTEEEAEAVCAVFDYSAASGDDAACVLGVCARGDPEHHIRLTFETTDSNRSGCLDKAELIVALRRVAKFDADPKRRECRSDEYFREAAGEIMRAADLDQDGRLSYDEWRRAHQAVGPALSRLAQKYRTGPSSPTNKAVDAKSKQREARLADSVQSGSVLSNSNSHNLPGSPKSPKSPQLSPKFANIPESGPDSPKSPKRKSLADIKLQKKQDQQQAAENARMCNNPEFNPECRKDSPVRSKSLSPRQKSIGTPAPLADHETAKYKGDRSNSPRKKSVKLSNFGSSPTAGDSAAKSPRRGSTRRGSQSPAQQTA